MINSNFKTIQAIEFYRGYVISIILKRWGISLEEANSEFDRWLIHDKDSICFIALDGDKPIGTGVFDTVRDEDGMDISPYNTLLWIEPEYRGNGYGRIMSKLRFDWALSKGYQIIYLDTLDAAKYHDKYGWKIVKHLIYEDEEFTIMQLILDDKLSFNQTRNIYEFGPILKPLVEDFDLVFYQTSLVWCKVIPSTHGKTDRLWEVWLVKLGNKPIGICGLYTLNEAKDTNELWLGWLGVIPELRNMGFGKQIMMHLYEKAKDFGCSKILSYVDKGGAPLSFYKREGFTIIGTVSEYCKSNGLKNIDGDDFEDGDDYVIMKEI